MSKSSCTIGAAVLVVIAHLLNCQTAFAQKTKSPDATASRPASIRASGSNTAAVARGTTNIISRVHAKIPKESEAEFLKLVTDRKNAMEEVRVIKRLAREKQAALEKLEARLATDYSIRKDRNYRYDSKTMTIHEVVGGLQNTNTAASAETSPAPRGALTDKRRVHMVIDSKEKADKFVQFSSSKQLTSVVLQALVLLEREKAGDLTRYNNTLLEKFGMSRDRGYEYDAKTGTLYELISMPNAATNVNR